MRVVSDDGASTGAAAITAHVEVRTEDDPDVAKYTHHRLIEKIICEEGPVVKKGLEALQKVAEPFLKRLQNAGALHSTDLSTLRAPIRSYKPVGIRTE